MEFLRETRCVLRLVEEVREAGRPSVGASKTESMRVMGRLPTRMILVRCDARQLRRRERRDNKWGKLQEIRAKQAQKI